MFSNLFNIGISFRRGRGKRRNKNFVQQPKKLHRLNEEIRAKEIRVITEEDENIGVCSLQRGLEMARERDVDLVEVSSKTDPPICKLIDYGKMLYALKKKEQKQRVANKTMEIKGIRLTFRMGEGDANRQLEKAQEFLEDGHPIKIQLLMKGREKAHKDLAHEKLKAFIARLSEFGSVDNPPKTSGHQIIAVVKPTKSTHN